MSLVLFRIDERLLHGQVIVGWGMRLGIEYYVVVDDGLAGSDWEKDLYSAGLPEGTSAEFLSVDEAIEKFSELDGRSGRGAILTRGTKEMRALGEAGHLLGRRVNIGGIHSVEGRQRALPYVYLTQDEADDLRAIEGASRSITARDLPTGREAQLGELLNALD